MATVMMIGGGSSAWGDIVDNGNGTFTQDFTGYSRVYNNGYIITTPDGWYAYPSNVPYSYNIPGTGSGTYHTSSPSIFTSAANNTSYYIISPVLTGNFKLWAKKYGTSNTSSVSAYKCSYDETNGTFSCGDLIQTITPGADFAEYEFVYAGVPTRVAVLINYAYIDDFTYTPYVSDTPQPTGFSYSVTAFDSVDLSWTEGGEETEWQIKYSTAEKFDPDEAGTLVDHDAITTNSYTLSGLPESTTYYAYVRAYIDEETQSDWTGPLSFTTYEQYPTPTDLTASNYAGEGTGATISWTDGDGDTPSSWQLRYSSSDFSPAGGEGELIDNIDDNTSTLTELTPGETYYVAVRACYGEGLYSSWTDKISFTTIAAWETFSDGIPSTWYNHNDEWRTNRSGYEGKASASSATSSPLRTPRLYAEAGQTISFDVTVNSGSLTARYYKNSRSSYSLIGIYTTSGTQTFTAPTTGYYWLQFTGYNCAIDNINGFGPSDTEHLMELGSNTMSSTGTVGGDYTARVNIRELGGTGETFTAELWYDGDKVAELDDQVIAGNRDMEVQLTFTPMEEKSSKPMYAKIIYDGGTQELTTPTTNVTFSNTEYVLDEDSEDRPASNVSARVVQFKYTAKNGWNTICVPFILNDTYLNQIFGSDWKAYTFSSYSDGVISFQKKSSSFAVSTPYLVYTENADDVDENKIYLKSAYINTSNYSSANMTQTKGGATFQGTLDTKYYEAEDNWYGVTPAGRIMKAGTGAYVKGYRAYFTGVSAPSDPASGGEVKMFILDDDDIPTDLGFVKMVDENAKEVYNLAGQKVQKGRKGIYIVNGKKVVIK